MKTFALFAAAALLASPAAFAADNDLCKLNLQEADDKMATSAATLGDPAKAEIEEHITQARQAQQSGDTEGCIVHSTKALDALKSPGGSETGTGGSAAGSAGSSGN